MSKTDKEKHIERVNAVERGIAEVLNKHGVDNELCIPDYILSRYLMRQLNALSKVGNEIAKHTGGNP